MRILLFTLEYPPFFGGVSKYYEKMVEYWPENGNIFVLDNNADKLINPKSPVLKWLKSVGMLYKTIKENKIEHVIVGHVLPLGISTLIVRRFLKFEYSMFLHGMDYFYAKKKLRKRYFLKKALKGASAVICNSNGIAEMISKEYPKYADKIKAVNPGVDKVFIGDNELASSKEKFNIGSEMVILTVGRVVKRKGVDKVLDALIKIYPQLPGFKYVIAGVGPDEDYIRDKITKLPSDLQEKVMMAGKVTDEEKWSLLFLCDMFVMPVREIKGDIEGFGIVFMEANLAGKPVIGGMSGGVKDAVVDGLNGIMVDPENIDEIGSAILKLAGNEELRLRLGSQGRDRAVKDFNWEGQARKIYDIIYAK